MALSAALVCGGIGTLTTCDQGNVAVAATKKRCNRCGTAIKGEYYGLHMERSGKQITVIDDGYLCKRCGDEVSEDVGMLK